MAENIREWLKEQFDAACAKQATRTKTTKDAEGNETTEEVVTSKREFDFSRFIDIAAENGIPAERVAEARGWLEVRNGPGRVRMTLGNQIYSAASKAGHLVVDGEQIAIPDAIYGPFKAAAEQKAAEVKAAKDAAKAEAAALRAAEAAKETEGGEPSAEPAAA